MDPILTDPDLYNRSYISSKTDDFIKMINSLSKTDDL